MSEHPNGGPGEAPGISRWVQELLQGSVRQRQAAARFLSSLRPLPPAALMALAQALADRDPGVAREVSRTLQGLGPEAIQPLLGALKHPRLAIRNKACK